MIGSLLKYFERNCLSSPGFKNPLLTGRHKKQSNILKITEDFKCKFVNSFPQQKKKIIRLLITLRAQGFFLKFELGKIIRD